jgi:hypothetical protein
MSEDVQRVIDYHQQGAFFSKTDHLLVKLITSMNVPLSYDLGQYYEVATARALAVANSLKLTSSISAGAWHEGVFYHGSQEIILATLNSSSPFALIKQWKRLSPVRVLDCPVSNLSYMLPDGKRHNTEEGFVTVSIDIPALMVMYRGFLMNQLAEQREGSEQNIGIRDFVGKYVIPNMLYSQTDLAVFNRLVNFHTGAPMGDSMRKHPFRVSDYSGLLDKGLGEVLARIQDVKMPYMDMLRQVPSIFSSYALEMPDVSETRQVWWALFLTRLKAVDFLYHVAGETGRHYNGSLMNELKVDLRAFNSENVYKSALLPDQFHDVQYQLKQMLLPL